MAIIRKQRLAPPISIRLTEDDDAYVAATARDRHLKVADIVREAVRLHRREAARRAIIGEL